RKELYTEGSPRTTAARAEEAPDAAEWRPDRARAGGILCLAAVLKGVVRFASPGEGIGSFLSLVGAPVELGVLFTVLPIASILYPRLGRTARGITGSRCRPPVHRGCPAADRR